MQSTHTAAAVEGMNERSVCCRCRCAARTGLASYAYRDVIMSLRDVTACGYLRGDNFMQRWHAAFIAVQQSAKLGSASRLSPSRCFRPPSQFAKPFVRAEFAPLKFAPLCCCCCFCCHCRCGRLVRGRAQVDPRHSIRNPASANSNCKHIIIMIGRDELYKGLF